MFNVNCQWTEEQIEAEANRLVSKMNLKEKVMFLSGNWAMMRDSMKYKRSYNPVPIESHGNKRLKIKTIAFTDGPRGVVMGNSTCFPVSMSRAASFDRDLEERVGKAIGEEARAGGADYFGGVCINLLMHPAGGRAQESYGEDPYLVGEMGAALVKGVQYHNVMACAKHYAVNNMENRRFSVDVQLDERTLQEVYLPHFKKAVDNGAASLMGSYNLMRGDHASESKHLLTDILRDQWNFKGFVITDFIFALRDSAKAINAGMDMEMPIPVHWGLDLKKAVEEGRVDESRVDEACRRVLRTQLTFEHAKDPRDSYDKSLICNEEHTNLAREAAEKGMVLLKNENVLPFNREIKKILVVGRLADTENTGDHGSSRVYAPYVVTAVEGLKKYLGSSVEVIHCNEDELEKAKSIAMTADAVVIIAGNDYNDEGECVMPDASINPIEYMAKGFANNGNKLMGKLMMKAAGKSDAAMASYTSDDGTPVGGDRKSLSLRPVEINLINEIAPLNKNTVVSLVCGSLLMTKEWEDNTPAILYSWYSGMEGGTALARVLFGDVNPSGKLPFAIPKDAADLPEVDFNSDDVTYDFFHGYRKLEHEGKDADYPFGFGLSYTSFSFANASAAVNEKGVAVSVDITNTGDRAGAEVAQVYFGAPESKVVRHVKKLCGFEKVELEAGETKTVEIFVPADELMYFDEAKGSFVLEDTKYRIYVGSSEADEDLLVMNI